MASDDGKLIGDDFPVVEPDIEEADDPSLEGNQHSSSVVPIYVLGITILIFAVCAICYRVIIRCKEREQEEREIREQRRLRDANFAPRRILPDRSAKRLSPQAPDRSPPVSTHSNASYRGNSPLHPNVASEKPLPFIYDLSSMIAIFKEYVLQRPHRDIRQGNESDSFREQEESSADELRRIQRDRDRNQQQEESSADELRRIQLDIFQSDERDRNQQQEEPSADELRRIQLDIFRSDERDRNQQQEESSDDELRRFHRSIFQSDERDRNQQQEESGADMLRRIQRSIFQSDERDRNQQQEESSVYELHRIARSIFQSDERDRNQQQDSLNTLDLPSSRRRSHESIEMDNFLQGSELNAAYTRYFLNISGLGTEIDDSHQQGELRNTSFRELLSYQRRFGRAIEPEDPLRQNESSAASSLRTRRRDHNIDSNNPLQHNESAASSLRTRRHYQNIDSNNPNESSAASSLRTRRHDQNIDSNSPLQHNESSTSSRGSLNTQRVSLGALASRFFQQNPSRATPFDGLSNVRRGSSLNTESGNSLQQHASSSTSSSEIPVHERGFDGLLPIAKNITTRSLDESLNRTESDTESDSEVKRHSSP